MEFLEDIPSLSAEIGCEIDVVVCQRLFSRGDLPLVYVDTLDRKILQTAQNVLLEWCNRSNVESDVESKNKGTSAASLPLIKAMANSITHTKPQ